MACLAESQIQSTVQSLLQKYPEVFKEGTGVMAPFKATLQLKLDSKPKFCKARSVLYVLKHVIELELDRLEKEGAVKKVNHSQ